MAVPLVIGAGVWGYRAYTAYRAYRVARLARAAAQASRKAAARKKKTCTSCKKKQKCKPCVPPAGTIAVERVDIVPPSRKHEPCTGNHAHLVKMNQAPNCKCFWNKANPDVVCLDNGETSYGAYPMRSTFPKP